jgi:hypothetical protein
MAEWRFGYGWTNAELNERLAATKLLPMNFDPEEVGFRRYHSRAMLALESPGAPVPGGPFKRAISPIENYRFSDPSIVVGHFETASPLRDRRILLELKVLGFHFLCGVVVTDVCLEEEIETSGGRETVFGFRYDTLQGHIEAGSEWFLLSKRHRTGEVCFTIQASWKLGDFPNLWSEAGFRVLGKRYQLAWHRLAYLRLREMIGSKGRHLAPIPNDTSLFHAGPPIFDPDVWALRSRLAVTRVQRAAKPTLIEETTEEP